MTATRDQLVAATESQSTGALAIALEELHNTANRDEAERMVSRVIIGVLYDRHPEIALAYNAWIDSDEAEDEEAVVIRAATAIAYADFLPLPQP